MKIFFILNFIIISGIFVILFYLINLILSFKDMSFEKISSFESGFQSIGKLFKSFSIHFFMIMLMFVIFDLEVIFIMSFIVGDLESYLTFMIIFLFMLLSLYLEWFLGKLLWLF